MNIELAQLWSEMGFPVKCVVFVLTLQAILSLSVAIDRIVLLTRSGRASRDFAKRIASPMAMGDYKAMLEESTRTHGAHLASLLQAGLTVFAARRSAGDEPIRAAELARRALERKGESTSTALHKGMGVLASTGSTAPFVGLLGTVLGIINAFQLIAANGSGGIGTIGAAIGEALIVTGYGLCVAIPTVLGFNFLSGRIAQYELALSNASSELADRLETSGTPVRVEPETAHQDKKRAAPLSTALAS